MDIVNRQRHKHRLIFFSRAEAQGSRHHARADQGAGLALQTGLLDSPEDDFEAENISQEASAPLPWLPDSSEQLSTDPSEIAARLKDLLHQCMPADSGKQEVPEATAFPGPAQSPQELLNALSRVVQLTTGPDISPEDEHNEVPGGSAVEPPELRAAPAPCAPDAAPAAIAALLKRHRERSGPTVTHTADGLRVEVWEDGAEITKDALGRVLEIHSALGETITFKHDADGNLDYFYRCDSNGHPHSFCKRDDSGVVVQDPQGRIRAAGEFMTVDPRGCLTIHNHDGQMVSIDLPRSLHIERRKATASSGPPSMVTAVFAHDGFRMTTHFHEFAAPEGMFRGESASTIRFYGRDGSLVEFRSEDDLIAVRPAKVLPPASMFINEAWRGKRQARTAWEAVQEYLELLF